MEIGQKLKNIISIKIYGAENDIYFNIRDLNSLVFRHYNNSGVINFIKFTIYKLVNKQIYFNLKRFFNIAKL